MTSQVRPRDLASHGGNFDSEAARDDDDAQSVVEVSLEARETDVELTAGHTVHLWTYNGVLPGPRIEANVGDRVIVHLTNALPESTTIHWLSFVRRYHEQSANSRCRAGTFAPAWALADVHSSLSGPSASAESGPVPRCSSRS